MGRRKKFENRLEIIVETAARLFLEQGFENTTMEMVAKESNMGKATLYTEFKSKEDLMSAVIERYMQQSNQKIRDKIDGAKGKYLPVLQDILLDRVLTLYDRVNRHFHSAEILMATRQGMHDRSKIKQQRDEERRLIANLLERAAQQGEIAPCESYLQLARLMRKALAGLYPPNVFDIARDEFGQDAGEVISIFLSGLTRPR